MKRAKSVTTILLIATFTISGCAVTTPKFTEEDITNRVKLDRDAMFKGQEPLAVPITLEEAMARALKYNLDHRIKIMENALSLRQADLAAFDMLPRIVASAGYTGRNSYDASSSMNVYTNQESLAPSTSVDKSHSTTDLNLTWNILDFGVSYFQAKQQSDRAHIMKERRRKVVHSIMQQVRQDYWLALGAQQLEGRFEPLLKDVEKAIQDTYNIENEKLRPQIETLTYRKTLLETMKQLEAFRDELAQAKPRLASLMNLPLNQSFTVALPPSLYMPKGPDALEYMEIRALLQRPELMESDYNERIGLNETYKAIARMFPGLEFSVGGHTDNNSFLVNKQWIDNGARLTWNLMNLISGPSQYKIASSQVEIAQMQRLALSAAILTQVHVSYQNFYSRKRQFELSEQLQEIDTRIHDQTKNQAKSGSQSQLNEIRSATSALMSEYRSYQNYASLQSACGQIVATIGDDPLPETVSSHEIASLSGAIGSRLYAPGALCSPIAVIKPVTVKVVSDSPPPAIEAKKAVPTLSVLIKPDVITSGNNAKLFWVAQNATKCTLLPGTNVLLDVEGGMDITPKETTTYRITCTGEGGQVTESSTIVVSPRTLEPVLPQGPSKVIKTFVLSLEFETGQASLKAEHSSQLKMLADYFKENPEATGEIEGHTDNVKFSGNSAGNIQLSQRRADNIRTYLINTYNIDPKRITAKGYGDRKPIADNRAKEGRRKNRRIVATFRSQEK